MSRPGETPAGFFLPACSAAERRDRLFPAAPSLLSRQGMRAQVAERVRAAPANAGNANGKRPDLAIRASGLFLKGRAAYSAGASP